METHNNNSQQKFLKTIRKTYCSKMFTVCFCGKAIMVDFNSTLGICQLLQQSLNTFFCYSSRFSPILSDPVAFSSLHTITGIYDGCVALGLRFLLLTVHRCILSTSPQRPLSLIQMQLWTHQLLFYMCKTKSRQLCSTCTNTLVLGS